MEKKAHKKKSCSQYSGSKKSQTTIGSLRIINSSFILYTTERLESIVKAGELNTPSYLAFLAVPLTKSRMKSLIYNGNHCRHPPSAQPHISWRKLLFYNKTRGILARQPAQGILKSEFKKEKEKER